MPGVIETPLLLEVIEQLFPGNAQRGLEKLGQVATLNRSIAEVQDKLEHAHAQLSWQNHERTTPVLIDGPMKLDLLLEQKGVIHGDGKSAR